jgi:phage terminase small subunit
MPTTKTKKPQLTGQQEIFAREYVRCGVAARAYRRAYNVGATTKPETVWRKAVEVMANGKVTARIEELTKAAAARAGVTKESMLIEMAQNREMAIDAEQLSVAQSASRDRAKVAGILVDRSEVTGKDGSALLVEETVTLEDKSANDLARRVAFLLAKGARKAKAVSA